jgi:NADH-quinone oxidoreductase subunit N
MGAFGVVTVLSDGSSEAEDMENYRGLFWRRPALAAIFTAMLLSLAGIPITAGFIGKFYVVAAGASSAMWALIVILVITSAIGLFYYLRIIVVMYGQPSTSPPSVSRLAPAGRLALALLTALLIWFGVFPGPLLSLIRNAIAGLA